MSRKNVEGIQFHVPVGKAEVIRQHAKKRGYDNTSEYIRQLIEKDINEGLDLTVERGYGRRKSDKTEGA